MKQNKMVEAIGGISDKYLNEAISYKPQKRFKYAGWMGLVALAACAMIIMGIGMFKGTNKADSVVALDINPSIELIISKHDKVLSVKALNEDAEVVLKDMDLKNVDLDTALNAIIGSLLKNGYLDEVYNAVNVCVENNDEGRANSLGEKFKAEIGNLFDDNDLIGGVNYQFCSNSEESKKLAEEYGVSVGKLSLAQTVSANTGMALEVAVELSISELWDLLDAGNANIITKDTAYKIAVADAKVEEAAAKLVSNKIQETGGLFTYAIKFTVGENELYKYEIDAVEGTILEREYEYVSKEETTGDSNQNASTEVEKESAAEDSTEIETESDGSDAKEEETKTPVEPAKQITKKEALAIAYKDAGVIEKAVKLEELKHKPVEKEYHIEFSVGLVDYVYVINAVDGSIISKESEDKTGAGDTTTDVDTNKTISADEALKIALAKAGIEFKDLTTCDIKYTVKKASAEYKVHFHVGKEHYEYTINAVTGEIVEKVHPTPVQPVQPVKPGDKEEASKPTPPTPSETPTTPELPTLSEKPTAPEAPTAPAAPTLQEGHTHPTPAGPGKKEDAKVSISFEKLAN